MKLRTILLGAAVLGVALVLTAKPDHKAIVRRDRAELRKIRSGS